MFSTGGINELDDLTFCLFSWVPAFTEGSVEETLYKEILDVSGETREGSFLSAGAVMSIDADFSSLEMSEGWSDENFEADASKLLTLSTSVAAGDSRFSSVLTSLTSGFSW